MHPLDPLVDPAGGEILYPAEGERWALGEWWELVGGASHEVRRLARGARSLGIAQENTAQAQLAVLGGWAAGVTVASIPPPRGAQLRRWATATAVLAEQCGFETVLVPDPERLGVVLAAHGLRAEPYPRLALGPAGGVEWASEFIQCTSGSTGQPRGVRLALPALAAHLDALAERLATPGAWRSAGWLPVNHDMGFVGLFLLGLREAARTGGRVLLDHPRQYLSNPRGWLQSLAESRATVTAAPDASWRLAARQLAAAPPGTFGDLSALRHGVNGGEPISWAGIEALTAAGARHGLDPAALRPGYGMAEIGLAVALTEGAPVAWCVNRQDLAAGEGAPRPWTGEDLGDSLVLPSCGKPLAGIEVTASGGGVGRLSLQSDQLFLGYAGEAPRRAVRWETPDIGFVTPDGEVVVVGRADDVIVVSGQKFHPEDLEQIVSSEPTVEGSRVAAVSDPGGGWWLVVGRFGGTPSLDVAGLRRLLADCGVTTPHEIIEFDAATFPRTSSGKPRRGALREQLSRTRNPSP